MKNIKIIYKLLILGLISSSFVVILFLFSEHQMHRNNAFIRRYPHHPITKKYDLFLKYNSYYIAGYENDILYLGNTTAPLHLLEIHLKTMDTVHIQIQLEKNEFPFQSVSIQLFSPYFFVMDGTVPCIFKGRIGDWQASLWMKNEAYFSRAIPVDSNKIYIRATNSKTNEFTLGLLEKSDPFKTTLKPDLLEKQLDGIFDVDGLLLASENSNTLGYIYFYRNQFLIMNSSLELLHKEETIDTVRTAQIQLSKKNKKGEIKMKTPPLIVNKTAALYKNMMMIHSNRLGKYEEKHMFNQAAIIDSYNWKDQTYEFSFYIYKVHQKTLKEFNVYDNYLVALIGDMLSVYQLKTSYFK